MSPPKQPPRPGSLPTITEEGEPGAAFREFRETSFGERPTVPPIPHDAVPRAQAVPRKPTQRGAPAPASEQRPPMSNPPPEDNPPMARPRARQASQRDASFEAAEGDRPSVVEFQRAVHARYGKASYSGPAWVLLLLLGLAMLGAIIYLLATRSQPAAANCATIDQQRATDSKVDALSTSFSALTEKVITDNQRMHNDFVQLELNVIRQNSTK